MDEVQVVVADRGAELIEPVQLGFLLAPVEVVAPVADEFLEIRDVGAVHPRFADLIGPTCGVEARVQRGNLAVRNVDAKRCRHVQVLLERERDCPRRGRMLPMHRIEHIGRAIVTKQFASKGDLAPKQVSFTELAPGAYAYTAEGDPNTGIVIGDDCVLIVDTQATPIMAQDVIAKIRSVTDKPIKHIVLSHYHAVRVLGASAYGAQNIIASRNTYDLIVERGQQDFDSELGRFPRLFEGVDSVPGLTWPNVVFDGKLTLHLGSVEVQIWHPGRGHTKGDTIVWLPKHKVLYSGDLVEFGATPYTGDAYHEDWPDDARSAAGTEARATGARPRRRADERG